MWITAHILRMSLLEVIHSVALSPLSYRTENSNHIMLLSNAQHCLDLLFSTTVVEECWLHQVERADGGSGN